MIPAIVGLASGTVLLLSRGEDSVAPSPTIARDLEVPLSGVNRQEWVNFLRAATCGNPRTVSPAFRLGTFGLTVRRLCDLGVMKHPRVIRFKGRQVWDADWKDPESLHAFQADPMGQYDLFVRSLDGYAKTPEVRATVGHEVDGARLTLSGALMLAHRAGVPGLKSWLGSARIRRRFHDNTTAFVQRANGIF